MPDYFCSRKPIHISNPYVPVFRHTNVAGSLFHYRMKIGNANLKTMISRSHTPVAAMLLAALFMASGCSDPEENFLRRNTEALSFDYTESSQSFTVRSSGDWKATTTDSWIKVSPDSGTGQGEDFQTVTVTCERNGAEERTGAVILSGSGYTDVRVEVYQKDGLFEFAGNYIVRGSIIKGEESGASISVPYLKAMGTEQFTVSAKFSGNGSPGLYIDPSVVYQPMEGDGSLTVPVDGTGTDQGAVYIDLEIIEGQTVRFSDRVAMITSEGKEIVNKDFHEFIWGGDIVANRAGVESVNSGNAAAYSLSDETQSCSATSLGAGGSGLTSTIRTSNPAFYAEIGLDGWYGLRNYMRPGYMQLGATTATVTSAGVWEYGCIITPGLDIPAGEKRDIFIQFKVALVDYLVSEMMAGLYPKNTQGITDQNIGNMIRKTYLPLMTDITGSWIEYSCVVENASNDYGMVLSISDNWTDENNLIKVGRLYIDDLTVTY